MQDIKLLNMLEAARNRAANQARIVAETRAQHAQAVRNSMIATAKRLSSQLKRQEMALAMSNEELRECEKAVREEGDLVTPAADNNNKKK